VTAFVALLRAVNVGGTGKLPMTELKTICEAEGFTKVKTYIASGNVVFETALPEAKVKAALEKRLTDYAGKVVGVLVRTAAEMRAVLAANPFLEMPSNRMVAIFLDAAPAADTLDHVVAPDREEVRLGKREIYIYYPQGQADTKLKVPGAKLGTARNINTVSKLAEMASALG
jgi:uncharacterized protein (DUF1697 family)